MKVMIIEDDLNIRLALARFLSSAGLTTTDTSNVIDAITLIDADPPDLAITDWDLGDQLSGIDVANYLTEVSTKTIIVFITGKSMKQLKESAAHLKVHTFLQKPFKLIDIKQVVDEIRDQQ